MAALPALLATLGLGLRLAALLVAGGGGAVAVRVVEEDGLGELVVGGALARRIEHLPAVHRAPVAGVGDALQEHLAAARAREREPMLAVRRRIEGGAGIALFHQRPAQRG